MHTAQRVLGRAMVGRGSRTAGITAARRRGQALVEFALVIPIFLVMLIGIIEFALALNSVLTINFATREAALVAAEAGNADGADCVILAKVEQSMGSPSNAAQISEVRVFKSDKNGVALATNRYVRSGSMSCTFSTTTVTVPYSLSGTENYPDTKRCNVLAGCAPNAPMPATTAVDHVGVSMTYTYVWHTPLKSLIDLNGTGYVLTKSNSMRMEPVL
jgi:Flp pilus assembly protein TadG